ncbi:unnamed protein product [Chironomus riparius]|uniref:Bulb-type lectin domain-containing protein n=1 Tax=Chironomus riparius TaxID=315576 RepID=A0A9N9RTM7_9DIPT|nr:unnamed protein product [Chironomus riparius]
MPIINWVTFQIKIVTNERDEFDKFSCLRMIIFIMDDSLGPNECLAVGETLVSANGCFRLIMQGDGNLVIYRQSNNKAIWSSKTSRTCTNRACMQGDGNFVTYDCHDKATWASKTSKKEGSWIIMQGDGNLVVYAWQSTRAFWSSKTVTYC